MEAYVFYSHYDYSDIWPLMFGQSKKYLNDKKKYFITNKINDKLSDDWNVIYYDENMSYQERVYNSLKRINEEIIIFHHEDMFLLNEPNWNVMKRLINSVNEDKVDLIKLIKASYNENTHIAKQKNLFHNPHNLLFSIQPTVIKKDKLIKIYKYTKGQNIWEFENNSNSLMQYLNYSSCYYHEGTENKRGMFHWDSVVYPYIATAVVKGKWDYESYPNVLRQLHNEYKIDPTIRGKNA
tara:strand:+ start:3080 stop:3793 length:714 start_codon:yes stop_codon:yes gene_type:complete